MSISSHDDTDSTRKSDSDHDSEHDSDVDMLMEDDVHAPDGVDLDGDVNMERDSDNDEEEDEEEEGEEKEDEEEDENEEKDNDEDDGKEPRTIGQGEMVNTSADNVDTMVDDQPIVLLEQCQEMHEYTPRPQPPAPAPWSQTAEPYPWTPTPETHPLSGREHLGFVTSQKPRPAVSTLQEAEAARNTSYVDVDQQLLIESAGGDSLPDVPLPDVALPDVALPDISHSDVPLPIVPLPDAPLPEALPDGSVGEEWTSPPVPGEAMVVEFRLGSGFCLVCFLCSNLFISGIYYYTCHEVFGFLKVYFIYGFCTGFIFIGYSLFKVL